MLTRSGVVVPPAHFPRKRIKRSRGHHGADDLSPQFLISQASLYPVARRLLNFVLRTCSLLYICGCRFIDEDDTRQGVRGLVSR
jgi:hypothetical protein